jgi:hypothetical protein
MHQCRLGKAVVEADAKCVANLEAEPLAAACVEQSVDLRRLAADLDRPTNRVERQGRRILRRPTDRWPADSTTECSEQCSAGDAAEQLTPVHRGAVHHRLVPQSAIPECVSR